MRNVSPLRGIWRALRFLIFFDREGVSLKNVLAVNPKKSPVVANPLPKYLREAFSSPPDG